MSATPARVAFSSDRNWGTSHSPAPRLKIDAPLAAGDQKTYYGGDAKGYTDYPTYSAA